MDILGYIIFVLWLAAVVFALCFIFQGRKQERRYRRYMKRTGQTYRRVNYLAIYWFDFLNWVLASLENTEPRPERTIKTSAKSAKQQLLVMLQGDERAANRLIRHIKAANPGQSEQWYWEKALWDLERDRRI